MTLCDSSYVNSFASSEDINLNFIPNIEFSLSVADFTNVALRGRVCLGNVTLLRLVALSKLELPSGVDIEIKL